MKQLFFLLCSLQLGYAWSLNGTCSAQDAEVCGRCTSKACEVHNNNLIGSIENVSSAMECQDWCKRRNDYINDCTYVTYFGSNGALLKNVCYIFSSCDKKVDCSNCVTETFECLCSSNFMGKIVDANLLEEVADIVNLHKDSENPHLLVAFTNNAEANSMKVLKIYFDLGSASG